MKILDIKHLTKSFQDENGKLVVLNDLSLEMEEGEFVAIVGTSGCGKSTLLHLIAGIDELDSGEIWVNGRNIVNNTDEEWAQYRRNETVLIYQFYNLIPILNVVDNIILPLKLDNRDVDQDDLQFLLDELQISDKKYAFPSQLSGGQQQRVAIARAMLTKPKLILADEPTGNLDHHNSQKIMDQFLHLHQKNHTTIIMVTHDIELAKVADRILVLENGKLHSYEE